MTQGSRSSNGPLSCPRCALSYPLDERFCANCGMPLVYKGRGDEEPVTDAHGRARKVRPQYARGEPVKVGWARNQAEAELIQGMLLDEGIPSMAKRTRGFDVPDFLAAGPRDILVPETGAETAKELLQSTQTETEGEEKEELAGEARLAAGGDDPPSPAKLAAWILIGVLAAALIVWTLSQVTG